MNNPWWLLVLVPVALLLCLMIWEKWFSPPGNDDDETLTGE